MMNEAIPETTSL